MDDAVKWAWLGAAAMGLGLVAIGEVAMMDALAMWWVVLGAVSFVAVFELRRTDEAHTDSKILEYVLTGCGSLAFGLGWLMDAHLPPWGGWAIAAFYLGCSMWALALNRKRAAG